MKSPKLICSLAIAPIMMFQVTSTAFAGPSQPKACWGQASKVFAMSGEMGEHSSTFPTPRLGLRNLARELYDAGILADDSMQSLGQFVADELGLSIDACMN